MSKTLPNRPGTPHDPSRRLAPPRRAAPGPLWHTSGTLLVAAAAALSLVLLGACGGGGDAHGDRPATGTTATAEAADTHAAGTTHPRRAIHAAESGSVGSESVPGGPLGLVPDGEPEGHAAGKASAAIAVDFRLESDYGPGEVPGPATLPVPAPNALAALIARADLAAAPVDPKARTRHGRYISRTVAERVAQESGGHVVWVDASCCAGLDPELPERIAFGMQAVIGDDAPLFVGGRDLRQAARLADRLHALGMRDVLLVTP